METIHFKTVDPVSQDLLRGASRGGLELNWERYEKQQPQDGFLRLGLSCPYGCMQGPCRIDPFGRGAEGGICGLNRDEMVAASLLRLTLQGILEIMDEHQATRREQEITWPAPLDGRAAAALAHAGGPPLSIREISESAVMLARPSAPATAIVRQAIRLGLLGLGVMEQKRHPRKSPGALECRAGYGLLAGEDILIGMAGRIPLAEVKALQKETAGLKKPKVRLVSLGDWIPAGKTFLPIACTSGEAETVLSAGKFHLLVAGRGADPGLLALSRRMKVPVVFSGEKAGAADTLKQARDAYDHRSAVSFHPAPDLVGKGRVSLGEKEVLAALADGTAGKIALLGGADTLQGSLGHLPVALAKALRGGDHAVASWGDAAVWMIKQDLPAGILDPREGPLAAVRALAAAGRLSHLKGISFTGLRDCRELTLALGLAALGLKVSVATPLPLWGSEKVRSLLGDTLAATGGSLAHFDHPVQAEEILDWFLRP